jgi:hypothetical protein
MKMSKWKICLIGIAAATGFGAPAMAVPIPVNVSDVQVNWSQGEGLTIQEGASSAPLYYAGPIYFTLNGSNMQTVVWCDDLYNDVYIGSSDQYYLVSAAAYLAPLTIGTVQDIAGLAFEGTQQSLANSLTPASGAEFQLAIWELEYGNSQDIADAGVQAGVNALIDSAPAFFSDMNAAGWTYSELDSPGCGQQPDSINYLNGCQVQGQLYAHPGTRIPEPGTIALLLSGVLGIGALRLRRKL